MGFYLTNTNILVNLDAIQFIKTIKFDDCFDVIDLTVHFTDIGKTIFQNSKIYKNTLSQEMNKFGLKKVNDYFVINESLLPDFFEKLKDEDVAAVIYTNRSETIYITPKEYTRIKKFVNIYK
jgi:hypothetical protein